jgi:hypothetical protein
VSKLSKYHKVKVARGGEGKMAAPASVPLLSDVEDRTNNGEEQTLEDHTQEKEAPKDEKKKSFVKAEYKIAFSHFVVSSD